MWPPSILQKVSSLLDSSSLPAQFVLFVNKILRPKWSSELSSTTSLLDFRDYAEDVWLQLKLRFSNGECEEPRFDLMQKELKIITDSSRRKLLVCSFLETCAQALRGKVIAKDNDFIAFALNEEINLYFEKSSALLKFRPLLSAPRDLVELVMNKMNSENTYESFVMFAELLGLVEPLNLWPVLALWRAHYYGESEDLFLHVPMPRVFGCPSAQYKDIERTCNFKTIARQALKPFNFEHVVLAGHGTLAYKKNNVWTFKQVVQAGLVCCIPGLQEKVWLVCPKSGKSSIYDIKLDKNILEFDLPSTECPTWIDCQRDSEGSLVLIWSTLNSITGSSQCENMIALDEDLLASGQGDFLAHISAMPSRRCIGTRLDFRDHGNLVNCYHAVKDSEVNGMRTWLHTYELCFANNLLMTLETDSRPIEAVFGSPFDIVLLSPLSSKQAIQHWTLNSENKFFMKSTSECPKNSKSWQSLSIYF